MKREELDRLETAVAKLGRQGHREARRDVMVSHFHALLAAARERDEHAAEIARLRAENEQMRALLTRVIPCAEQHWPHSPLLAEVAALADEIPPGGQWFKAPE